MFLKLLDELDIGANVGSAYASGSPKAVLSSLPEVINFYHTGKELNLGNFFFKFPFLVSINDYTYIKEICNCNIRK